MMTTPAQPAFARGPHNTFRTDTDVHQLNVQIEPNPKKEVPTMANESPNMNLATGTVGFQRKISVRQYESAEASMYVQFDIPTDPSLDAKQLRDQIVANARAAFFSAKAVVFEELAIEFTVGPDGVVHELLNKTFGKVTEVTPNAAPAPAAFAPAPVAAVEPFPEYVPAAAPAAPVAAPAAAGGANPPYAADTQDKQEKYANKAWAMADVAANPDGWYDNRLTRKNPKAPDFKHKASGMALWV